MGKSAEKEGLSDYEADTGRTVNPGQVKASVPGASNGRFYDGLAEKDDGTYEGFSPGRVKSAGPSTGVVESNGCGSAADGCAEADLVGKLGGDASKIRFTTPVRPRTVRPKSICTTCQDKFTQDQFPEGTEFEPGEAWSNGGNGGISF